MSQKWNSHHHFSTVPNLYFPGYHHGDQAPWKSTLYHAGKAADFPSPKAQQVQQRPFCYICVLSRKEKSLCFSPVLVSMWRLQHHSWQWFPNTLSITCTRTLKPNWELLEHHCLLALAVSKEFQQSAKASLPGTPALPCSTYRRLLSSESV